MIVLYTLLLLVLGITRFMVSRRARSLERRYSKVAAEANRLANEAQYRPGNSNRADLFTSAKRQYRLGQVAEKRDRLEARHFGWQRWADKVGRALDAVRSWKGKKLPYTLGVVDVSLALYLIDHFGLGDRLNWEGLVEMAQTVFSR
jgi:hypothetical protein